MTTFSCSALSTYPTSECHEQLKLLCVFYSDNKSTMTHLITILCLAVLIAPWVYFLFRCPEGWQDEETQTWHEGEEIDL